MASSHTPEQRSSNDPLSFMTRLSDKVSLYRPDASASSVPATRRPDPKLILVLSWMDARDPHIAKYIAAHRALFPTSQILLVRDRARHHLSRAAVEAALRPAVAALRACALATAGAPELLVHAFSNGGSGLLANLYRLWGGAPPLPPHVLVLDSCPGQFRYRQTVAVLGVGLGPWARRLLAPLFHAVVLCCYVFYRLVGRRRGPLARNAAAHNDPAVKGGTERARAYIYSDVDQLIAAADVESHAAEARASGFTVRVEKFVGSPHVAHLKTDEVRYCKIVEETWEEGLKRSGLSW